MNNKNMHKKLIILVLFFLNIKIIPSHIEKTIISLDIVYDLACEQNEKLVLELCGLKEDASRCILLQSLSPQDPLFHEKKALRKQTAKKINACLTGYLTAEHIFKILPLVLLGNGLNQLANIELSTDTIGQYIAHCQKEKQDPTGEGLKDYIARNNKEKVHRINREEAIKALTLPQKSYLVDLAKTHKLKSLEKIKDLNPEVWNNYRETIKNEALLFFSNEREHLTGKSLTEIINQFQEFWKLKYAESLEKENTAKTKFTLDEIELLSELESRLDNIAPSPTKAHFSPGIIPVLCKLVHDEQDGVSAAYYRFTHHDLAQAFMKKSNELKQRGGGGNPTPVQLIVDKEFKKDNCQALIMLLDNNIPVTCNGKRKRFRTGRADYENMHHKFMILHQNKDGKPLLVTGSFNPTGQANTNSSENIVIIDDPEVIAQHQKEFEDIMLYCRPVTKEECDLGKPFSHPYTAQINGF